jgi:hypothetical protein
MKILIFTEGTILMHKNANGLSRGRIVEQIRNKEKSVKEYTSYIPIGNCVNKLKKWKSQGAKIFYLTSRKKVTEVSDIKNVLNKFNFPKGKLLFREKGEIYARIAEKIKPDILIEDNCESIGGMKEMTITNVNQSIKNKIKSIVIREFEGIDFLPDEVDELKKL